MKILHTSDWHLGKKLFKTSRLEEQVDFLHWLEKTILEEKIDILIIAGDIFDTPNPPSLALQAYFGFLKSITQQTSIEIIVLSGNHDSGNFIEAPSPFLESERIHLIGKFTSPTDTNIEAIKNFQDKTVHTMQKGEETCHIISLPYFRSSEILAMETLKDSNLENEEELLLEGLRQWIEFATTELKGIKILVAHHLFGSFMASGSEQGLSLSGLESLPLSLFSKDFDYLALGHIHKPQYIKKESPIAYYPGSPIALRFSETHEKTISIVEIKNNKIHQTVKPIPVFRKLQSLQLKVEDKNTDWKEQILKQIKEHSNHSQKYKSFIECHLYLKSPMPTLIDQIRDFFSENNMELMSIIIHKEKTELEDQNILKNVFNLNHKDLFTEFWKTKYPDTTLPNEIQKDFQSLMAEIQEEQNATP